MPPRPSDLAAGLITLVAPGFSVGQARRQPSARSQYLSGIANGEWFGRVNGSSLTSLLSTVPMGSVRYPGTAWELVRRLVFFHDNLRVFVAYKVIGRELAIGFRGLGMNEARPILEPSIRPMREKGRLVRPSSTRILSTRSVRDRPRRYTASSDWTGFPSTTQSIRGAHGLRDGAISRDRGT